MNSSNHFKLQMIDNSINTSKNNDNSNNQRLVEAVNNNIFFYSDVTDYSILLLNKLLMQTAESLLSKSIKIFESATTPSLNVYINSVGGYLMDGLSGMDTILKIKKYITVNTIVDGKCASAATLLSMVGTNRYIKEHSHVLIHQLSSAIWGTYEEIKDHMENSTSYMKMLKELYKTYTKIPMKKLDEILKHDLYFNSDLAIQYGIADKIF